MKRNCQRTRARKLCVGAQRALDAEAAVYLRVQKEQNERWERVCRLLGKFDTARGFLHVLGGDPPDAIEHESFVREMRVALHKAGAQPVVNFGAPITN